MAVNASDLKPFSALLPCRTWSTRPKQSASIMGRLHWRRELLRGAWDARVEGGEGIVLEIDMYFLYKVQMLITAGLLRRHRATARLATMLNQHLATYQYAWRPRHDLAMMSSTGP